MLILVYMQCFTALLGSSTFLSLVYAMLYTSADSSSSVYEFFISLLSSSTFLCWAYVALNRFPYIREMLVFSGIS